MILPKYVFWDSCVFFRYLTRQPKDYLDDIDHYVENARDGQCQIVYSTLALVEIKQSALNAKGYGSRAQFFADMGTAFYPIEPNPVIMIAAGELKDARAVNPANDKTAKPRVIGTPDAVHLMTCIYARDTLDCKDIVFHTFDDGKGATWEGKCVPLLSFEKWFPEQQRADRVKQVCELNRSVPKHPSPRLFEGQENATPLIPQSGSQN